VKNYQRKWFKTRIWKFFWWILRISTLEQLIFWRRR